MDLNPDFKDLLRAFADADVRYLIVGGYAVSFHTRPRFTKDVDLWVEDSEENLFRIERALTSFGAPPAAMDALRRAEGLDVVWMGTPPMRVDLLKATPGGNFAMSFAQKVVTNWDGVEVFIIGREHLIALKKASGRPQDLDDVQVLEGVDDGPAQ